MTDVMERLRAANPEPPCAPPPIEGVWRLVDSRGAGGRTRGAGRRFSRPAFVLTAVSALTAIAVAVLAVALIGHAGPGRRAVRIATATPPSRAGSLDAAVRALRGRPVVVVAWASWCLSCEETLRLAAQAQSVFTSRHVAFIGADVDDVPLGAHRFLAAHPLGFPSYSVPLGQPKRLLGISLSAIPTTVFVAPDGGVVRTHFGGYTSEAALVLNVEELLGGHPPSQSSSPSAATCRQQRLPPGASPRTGPPPAPQLVAQLAVLRRPPGAGDRTAVARCVSEEAAQLSFSAQSRHARPPQMLSPAALRYVGRAPLGGQVFLYTVRQGPGRTGPAACLLTFGGVHAAGPAGCQDLSELADPGGLQSAQILGSPRQLAAEHVPAALRHGSIVAGVVRDGIVRVEVYAGTRRLATVAVRNNAVMFHVDLGAPQAARLRLVYLAADGQPVG